MGKMKIYTPILFPQEFTVALTGIAQTFQGQAQATQAEARQDGNTCILGNDEEDASPQLYLIYGP